MANKNFIVKNGLEVGGQEVVSSSGVVTSAALGGQTLASTDSPTFNNLTLTNDIAVGGDINLTGDLNITGDVNTLSVTDLDVTDQTITLGKGQVESASGGSGIVIDGSSASILWDETNDTFDINKGIDVTGTITSDGLTVDGTGAEVISVNSVANGSQIAFDSATTSSDWLMGISNDATDDFLIYQAGAGTGDIRLYTDGTERLTVLHGGNVGIGTSSPNSKTHIVGAANAIALRVTNAAVDGNNADVMHIEPSNGAYYGKLLRIQSGRSDFSDSLLFLNTTTGMNGTNGSYMRVQNNLGADIFRIKGDGNVGIGTTSPNAKLHVNGYQFITESTNNPRLYLKGGRDFFLTSTSAGAFGLYDDTASSYRMVIDASGNVDIGGKTHVGADTGDISMDASASGQLEVDGNGYQGAIALDASAMHIYHNSATRDLILGTDETARVTIAGSSGNVTFAQDISSVNNLYVADDIGHAGDSDTYMSFENDYLGFYTGGANTLVLYNGQVGVGGSPAAKFSVDVGAPGSTDQTLGLFQSQAGRQIGFVWDDSTSTLGVATLTNHALTFHTNGNSSERMRLTSDGVAMGDTDGDYTHRGATGGLNVKRGGILINGPDGDAVMDSGTNGNQWTYHACGGRGGTFTSVYFSIPNPNNGASGVGYGGFSVEFYIAGYNGKYHSGHYSGYVNGSIVQSGSGFYASSGSASIAAVSVGSQGFKITVSFPSITHPTAKFVVNKGGHGGSNGNAAWTDMSGVQISWA